MTNYSDNKVRIGIDVVLLFAILFNAGVGWQQIQAHDKRIELLERQNDQRSEGYQRLARVETKVDQLQADVRHLLDRLDGDTDRKSR